MEYLAVEKRVVPDDRDARFPTSSRRPGWSPRAFATPAPSTSWPSDSVSRCPSWSTMYHVLYEDKDPMQAVRDLMGRTPKAEAD